jgi:hypothetical protein
MVPGFDHGFCLVRVRFSRMLTFCYSVHISTLSKGSRISVPHSYFYS